MLLISFIFLLGDVELARAADSFLGWLGLFLFLDVLLLFHGRLASGTTRLLLSRLDLLLWLFFLLSRGRLASSLGLLLGRLLGFLFLIVVFIDGLLAATLGRCLLLGNWSFTLLCTTDQHENFE